MTIYPPNYQLQQFTSQTTKTMTMYPSMLVKWWNYPYRSKVLKWIIAVHSLIDRSLYLTLRSKVWKWILAIHSIIDKNLYLTFGSKVLRWILAIHSLINRSLSKFIFHLSSFTFLVSKDSLLLLSFSFIALNQKTI